jgi:hypothetical protein
MSFTSVDTWWLLPAVSCSSLLWYDRFQLRSDVNLKDVVSLLPDKLTGADLYSVCSHAWAIALRTQIHNLTHGIYSVAVVTLSNVQYYSYWLCCECHIHICPLQWESLLLRSFLQNLHSLVSVSFNSFTGLLQTVDCCLLTAEPWVQSHGCPYGICGGQSGTRLYSLS